jgi:hypothetical protein
VITDLSVEPGQAVTTGQVICVVSQDEDLDRPSDPLGD